MVIVLRFSIMEIYVLEINKSSEAKNNVNSLVIGEIAGHSSLQTTIFESRFGIERKVGKQSLAYCFKFLVDCSSPMIRSIYETLN